MERCTHALVSGTPQPLEAAARTRIADEADRLAARGLRVLAAARRPLRALPADRDAAERELCLVGLIALHDLPRPGVPEAVERCRRAGIRMHVVSGDHGLTATFPVTVWGVDEIRRARPRRR